MASMEYVVDGQRQGLFGISDCANGQSLAIPIELG